MPGNERNRNSVKGSNEENRTGNKGTEKENYRKLPDNPSHRSDESISTVDNTAGGKYSKTNKRDDEVDNDDTRGGR